MTTEGIAVADDTPDGLLMKSKPLHVHVGRHQRAWRIFPKAGVGSNAGMNLSAMAVVTLPLVAIWGALVLRLGREHAGKAAKL